MPSNLVLDLIYCGIVMLIELSRHVTTYELAPVSPRRLSHAGWRNFVTPIHHSMPLKSSIFLKSLLSRIFSASDPSTATFVIGVTSNGDGVVVWAWIFNPINPINFSCFSRGSAFIISMSFVGPSRICFSM